MTDEKGESVLSRWSRRKLEAKEIDESPLPVEEVGAASDDQLPQNVEAEEPEAPVLTDADMPDIDTLTDESDFSPFMSPGVSEELRKLALRKMFRSTVFNVRDGLDEYDDDFTTFEKLGDIVTSDMKHRIEMEQQKLKEKLEAEGSVDDEGIETASDESQLELVEASEDQQLDEIEASGHDSPENNPEEDIDEQY